VLRVPAEEPTDYEAEAKPITRPALEQRQCVSAEKDANTTDLGERKHAVVCGVVSAAVQRAARVRRNADQMRGRSKAETRRCNSVMQISTNDPSTLPNQRPINDSFQTNDPSMIHSKPTTHQRFIPNQRPINASFQINDPSTLQSKPTNHHRRSRHCSARRMKRMATNSTSVCSNHSCIATPAVRAR